MKDWVLILVVFFFAEAASAQSGKLQFDPKWKFKQEVGHQFNPTIFSAQQTKRPFPSAWCYDDLAFFCKVEVKMERATRFPIKFRLGDVHYVDMLERKIPSY